MYTRVPAPTSCAPTRDRWATTTAWRSAWTCPARWAWRQFRCRPSAFRRDRTSRSGITWCASHSASATRPSTRPSGGYSRSVRCADMDGYPRDIVGYGPTPTDARWPSGAAIAVQFVLNYEEGAENCVIDGDAASETFLSEMTPATAFPDRHMSMESLYEYGSRAGLWRLLRLFERRSIPLTIFAVSL